MYNETQLQAIRLFGRKDLTYGLIFSVIDISDGDISYFNIDNYYYFDKDFKTIKTNSDMDDNIDEYEILGHEPHLEDLFRVAEEKGWNVKIDTQFTEITFYVIDGYGEDENIAFFQYSPTLPLLSQPNLSEIVNLFF